MSAHSTYDTTPRDGTCEMHSGKDPAPSTHARCRAKATHVGIDDEGDKHLLCSNHMKLVEYVFDVRALPNGGVSDAK